MRDSKNSHFSGGIPHENPNSRNKQRAITRLLFTGDEHVGRTIHGLWNDQDGYYDILCKSQAQVRVTEYGLNTYSAYKE